MPTPRLSTPQHQNQKDKQEHVLITQEIVEAVQGKFYTIKGVQVVGADVRAKVGDKVHVQWFQGRPVRIIDYEVRRGYAPTVAFLSRGAVEELFIERNPNASTNRLEVWFRNNKQVTILRDKNKKTIRDLMKTDIISRVAWGPGGIRLLVEALDNDADIFKYYVFKINRRTFGAPISVRTPVITLERVDTLIPIEVCKIACTRTETSPTSGAYHLNFNIVDNHVNYSNATEFVIGGVSVNLSGDLGMTDAGMTSAATFKKVTTLTPITESHFAGLDSPRDFWLNEGGDVLLSEKIILSNPFSAASVLDFNSCTNPPIPSSGSLTQPAVRFETHAVIFNLTKTKIIFSTLLSTKTMTEEVFGIVNQARMCSVNLTDEGRVNTNFPPVDPPRIERTHFSSDTGPAFPPLGEFDILVGETEAEGDLNQGIKMKTLNNSVWNPAFPFYVPSEAVINSNVIIYESFWKAIANIRDQALVPADPPGTRTLPPFSPEHLQTANFIWKYTRRTNVTNYTLSESAVVRFDVQDILIVATKTTPEQTVLLLAVSKTTAANIRDIGIFLIGVDGAGTMVLLKQVVPFERAENTARVIFLALGKTAVMWEVSGATVGAVTIASLLDDPSHTSRNLTVGQDNAKAEDEYFKFLTQDSLTSKKRDLLFDAKETDVKKPAGFFADPEKLDENKPTFPQKATVPTVDGKLHSLPPGLLPPVTSKFFTRDFLFVRA